MSDIPRDRRSDDDPGGDAGSSPAAFPVTGDTTTGEITTGDTTTAVGSAGDGTEAGAAGGGATGRTAAAAGATGGTAAWGGEAGGAATSGSARVRNATTAERERRQRRRRRLIAIGVAVAAAMIVIALCAGGLAVLRSFRWISDDAREQVRLSQERRDAACLELEERLNRVAPPGSAANPPARAGAIRNENAALRPYLAEVEMRNSDNGTLVGWRQLLDARTAYAEALDKQAPSRTPAFFVVPRTPDGAAVSDQLTRASPGTCAASIRRLAAPDL